MSTFFPALNQLCQARPQQLAIWLAPEQHKFWFSLLLICIGGMLYGSAIGILRSPLQAIYVAFKFPLLLLLTALGNALINGMLAQLLGAPIRFRQSLLAVLMSFALLAVILGALAPLSWFFAYALPADYDLHLFSHTLMVGFAGVIANLRLYHLLGHICSKAQQALQILLAWLAINLFLGAQISWNLRPFIGTPDLPVHFLRDDPFNGSFFERILEIILGAG